MDNSVTSAQYDAMRELVGRCLDEQRRVDRADGAALPPAVASASTAASSSSAAAAAGEPPRPPRTVPFETVEALRCQMYARRHKSNDGAHKRNTRALAARWRDGESIVRIAHGIHFSSAALARILISELCNVRHRSTGDGGSGGGAPPGSAAATAAATAVVAGRPSTAAAPEPTAVSKPPKQASGPLTRNQKTRVKELLRGGPGAPPLIVDRGRPDDAAARRFRREIDEAVEADLDCGPVADHIRHSIGIEYEYLLQEKLRDRDIAFLSEEELRQRDKLGKTPDAKLCAPIGVQGADGRWHEVNWIDSKAQFGDPDTHKENLDQLWGYHNRFGPGMVVYWFGFVDTLNDGASRLHPCITTGGFPLNVITI
jgi:hypothetical protein